MRNRKIMAKKNGDYIMMRKVIASCHNNFQPFLERQLHQVSLLSSFFTVTAFFSAQCPRRRAPWHMGSYQ